MGTPETSGNNAPYKGLGGFLHIVRWSQHLLAIIAEILILISFAMSGMDVSLGGVMASIPLLKILWAAMFALGIDTAFALSWVRVRQCINNRQWWPLAWNMLLALSMSIIIFQPIAIQLMQQTLNISFNQAVTSLGINIVLLTYARSAVAIFLGAILAMTNVEQPTVASIQPTTVSEEQSASELTTVAQTDISTTTTSEQRAQKVSEVDFTSLSAPERITKVMELFPDLSDRELGKLSGVAAATAKKHRETLKTQTASEVSQ